MLIPSKTSRPLASEQAIVRSRLLEILDAHQQTPLILLQSPAGFGKTTLVSQWIKSFNQVGWYALDESDNQIEHFASYFIASIMMATDGRIIKTQALVNKHQYASLNALFSQLFVELSEIEQQIYLVLDDYHLITNEEIHGALRFFLRHQPDNITLLLLTRSNPPVGIAKLRVKGKLLELTHQQLAFTPEECLVFFHGMFGIDLNAHSVNTLCASINGWPTALQLIALKAQSAQIPHAEMDSYLSNRLMTSHVDETHLTDYLYEEVFEPLPICVKYFLMCASQVSILSNELCKLLILEPLNEEDALSPALYQIDTNKMALLSLELLEQQGLFLYRKAINERVKENLILDPLMSSSQINSLWYGFHPLFGSFLQKNALELIPNQIPRLHVIAAQYWLEKGIAVEAINHAKQAKDTSLLIQIMQQHAWNFFHQSKLTLLESCFQALSQPELIVHSELVLLKAWLAQSQHRYESVHTLLNEADAKRLELGITIDEKAQGCIDALRAQVSINLGQVQLARQLAHDALGKLDLDHSTAANEAQFLSLVTFSRIVAHSVIGEAYHCEGQLTAALQSMQETVVLARKHQTHHYVLWAIIQQSEILMAQGHLMMAYDLQANGFDYINEFHLEQLPLHEFLLRIRAQLLLSLGRIDEAEAAARQGLLVLSHYQPQKQLQCLAILARCGLVRGALNHAQTILLKCESLIQSDFYHQDWVHNVDKARVIYWQLSNNHIAANNWLLNQTTLVDAAGNHFTQGQSQNIVRALILVEQYDKATHILDGLITFASNNTLVSDLNRNYILLAIAHHKTQHSELAIEALTYALELGVKTGFKSEFLIEGVWMLEILNALLSQSSNLKSRLNKETLGLAQALKIRLEEIYPPDIIQFDESFIELILSHRNVPEVLVISPLTMREWQVLGLIYSGLSNDDICQKIDVAMTTLKTHIRNIYQKINVSHRAEAIKFTEKLLMLKNAKKES